MNQTEVHNPVLAQIHQHASVRRYKPDPVPRDWVEAIVAAGQRAATSSNLQAYSVVAVTDAAVRREAAHWCGDQAHIAEAPVFLVWCADLSRLERVCELRGMQQVTDYVENFLVAVVDTALAMQNAALAAESLGLGTCYIGGIRNHPREIIRLLGLPRLTFPIAGMTLGFPAVRPEPRPRLPLRAVLHWERYDRAHEDEALREYDRVMAATGIYDRRQIPVPGKPEQLEDYGWLEHTARRISQPTRTRLRDVLREQGFALL
ncbi:MAG: NADPH-dependent oxidoreductase [Thermoflexales bacterium]|nr:NADPH-dependent oxidoreductase [Thermoflexales bacterium]MDW8054173.1 NADPH-dependent oxidoreductase [Anaerolineae bacterium]MDW8292307.1 NADPH-dependent oxidoreductase [Anaerolineae bacterium]